VFYMKLSVLLSCLSMRGAAFLYEIFV
jgi:hypothetical protein